MGKNIEQPNAFPTTQILFLMLLPTKKNHMQPKGEKF